GVVSELMDPERAEVVDGDADREREVRPRDLLEHREVRKERLPAAAVALVVRDPAEPHLPELREQLSGELLLLLVRGRRRRRALLRPLPGEPYQLALVGRESEVPIHG